MGKGELLRSAPRNRELIARGNYAVPEGRTYDSGVLGVTPGSDVIREVKEMTNAGTSAAAGVVTGAWCW